MIPRVHRIGIALFALFASAVASADAPTARDAWAATIGRFPTVPTRVPVMSWRVLKCSWTVMSFHQS